MDTEKQKAGQSSNLKVAGSSGSGQQDEGIGIVMSMDKDEATRRQERDAEAAAKRQQNLLPAWHLKSTITGDLTALGIQENARTVIQPALPSGDESLKGLGTIGSSRLPQIAQPAEDIKPEINTEADCESSELAPLLYSISGTDYEQYYASLAASNAASAQATPSGLGSEDLEEEEPKHMTQHLETLNGYRKRSRSQEDEGAAAKKLVKLEQEPPDTNGAVQEAETGRGDGPLVSGMGHEVKMNRYT